jgi:MerR family transcriptional regulator/heat shock protein HspR
MNMNLIIIHKHEETEEKLPLELSGLHPSLINRLAELGVIDIADGLITPLHLRRAYRVIRLGNSLKINLTGAAVVVDLLEKMEEMQEEIKRLQNEVNKFGF